MAEKKDTSMRPPAPPPAHLPDRSHQTAAPHKGIEALAEDFGHGLVAAVDEIRLRLVEIRAAIAADGPSEGVLGRDATSVAGCIARALREAGGRLPDPNPHALRWILNESPTPLQDPDAVAGASQLVSYVLSGLKRGRGPDPVLDRIADVWPGCRTKAEADAKVAALDHKDAEAIRHAQEAAHHERLAKMTPGAKLGPKPRLEGEGHYEGHSAAKDRAGPKPGQPGAHPAAHLGLDDDVTTVG
jgi:hypothetical protein